LGLWSSAPTPLPTSSLSPNRHPEGTRPSVLGEGSLDAEIGCLSSRVSTPTIPPSPHRSGRGGQGGEGLRGRRVVWAETQSLTNETIASAMRRFQSVSSKPVPAASTGTAVTTAHPPQAEARRRAWSRSSPAIDPAKKSFGTFGERGMLWGSPLGESAISPGNTIWCAIWSVASADAPAAMTKELLVIGPSGALSSLMTAGNCSGFHGSSERPCPGRSKARASTFRAWASSRGNDPQASRSEPGSWRKRTR
jgi:hypothetical protein